VEGERTLEISKEVMGKAQSTKQITSSTLASRPRGISIMAEEGKWENTDGPHLATDPMLENYTVLTRFRSSLES
jgi:hypothetical protein